MRIACGGLRNQDFLFALFSSHFSLSESESELEARMKSLGARGATGDRVRSRSSAARARSLARFLVGFAAHLSVSRRRSTSR